MTTDRAPTAPATGDGADVIERAYEILSGDDATERACEAIPDAACTEVPRNYVLNVFNGACTKLAEQLASPQLVLPWIIGAIGGPAYVVGWLVPLKQAGSLLPQIAVAARIRALSRRKWAWTAAGTIQAAMLVLMALAVAALPPAAATAAILLTFLLFSLASGMGSVAFQDVTGKTVPKGARGGMLANRAAIGGALTLAAAALMKAFLDDGGSIAPFIGLILLAAALWAVASLAFSAIEEEPGETGGGRNMTAEVKVGIGHFRRLPGFRRFLYARALLLAVELVPPFLALLAQDTWGGALGTLGIYVFAVGVANFVASPFWGRLADRSSRWVSAVSGAFGAAAAGLAVLIAWTVPGETGTWLYGFVFLLVGIAEAGVRLGRKTYLVDAAPSDERATLVAFSNTSVGVLALAAGALGLVATALGSAAVVGLMGALALVGAFAAYAMPEAERMMDT